MANQLPSSIPRASGICIGCKYSAGNTNIVDSCAAFKAEVEARVLQSDYVQYSSPVVVGCVNKFIPGIIRQPTGNRALDL